MLPKPDRALALVYPKILPRLCHCRLSRAAKASRTIFRDPASFSVHGTACARALRLGRHKMPVRAVVQWRRVFWPARFEPPPRQLPAQHAHLPRANAVQRSDPVPAQCQWVVISHCSPESEVSSSPAPFLARFWKFSPLTINHWSLSALSPRGGQWPLHSTAVSWRWRLFEYLSW